MTANACLQVLVSSRAEAVKNFDVMMVVAKVTNAYLESRWAWPRKFSQLSKTSFLLSDPRASVLDAHELKNLSSELQVRLFGVGDAGNVALAVYEGSETDAVRFATMKSSDVLGAIENGLETVGLSGRLTRVTAHDVNVVEDIIVAEEPVASAAPAMDYERNKLLYRGIYLAPKQQFVGCVASRFNPNDSKPQSVLDGPSKYPSDPETFDAETMAALLEMLNGPSVLNGRLLLPLNYSVLSRRTGRENYARLLQPLAKFERENLTALIYDAPRTIQHHVLSDIKAVFQPYFGQMDLCVADPGVEIAMLETGVIRSLTLSLSNADDEIQRESAIKRFFKNRDLFREKRIWPMVGNVRTRNELRTCLAAGAPFMYGPALTDILETPVGQMPYMAQGLPVAA